MNRTYDILIDLSNPKQNIIALKRGDQRATYLRFTIMNKNQLFDLTDAYLVTVKGIKPDGTVIYSDAEIDKENSIVTWQVSEQSTTVKGKSIYELQIVDEDLGIITSFDFYVSIENNAFDETDYLSTDDLSAFRAYMNQTQRNSDETRRYVNAFRDAYGEEQVLINEQQELYEFFDNYLADVRSKVESGYFNGARGQRGEDGHDGVISEVGMVIGFEFVHGNLIVHYTDSALDFDIDDSGHLIISEGE